MTVFNYPAVASPRWKAPVQTFSDLPLLGNVIADVRVVRATSSSYIWSGTAWVSATATAGITTTDVTNFGVILSATDIDVQKALDTVDNVAVKKAASSTDNAIVRFDGTTGQLIQDSLVTIDDSGNIATSGTVDGVDVSTLNPQQIVTVAKSGSQFTTIQAAIDSIVDASSSKQYLIKIASGIYTENLTGKDYVSLEGVINGAVTVIGTYTSTITGSVSVSDMTFQWTPTADNQIVFHNSGGIFYVTGVVVNLTGTGDYIVNGMKLTSGVACTALSSLVQDRRSGNITQNFIGVEYAGTGNFSMNNVSVSARAAYTSAIVVLSSVSCTGGFSAENGVQIFGGTGTFSGSVFGIYCDTVSAQQRVWSNAQITLTSASGGTSYGMGLDSGSQSAEFLHVGTTVFCSGFASSNSTLTGITDTQKVWLQSANKDMPVAGNGLAIITPYAEAKSGFVQWSQDPAITTYWTYNAATKLFKVDKRGTGVVRGAPVVWAKNQTVTLTDLTTNYVYMNSLGIIGVQSSWSEEDSESKISLFEVYVEGLNSIVCKENHPYKFTSAISSNWHSLFGSLLQDASQTLAIASGVNRTTNLVGTNTINDHGVTTSIAAQSPMSITQVVQNTSTGAAYVIATAAGIVSVKSAANNTGTNVANSRFVNYRLGVVKDSLNSASPVFVSIADSSDFGTAAAALTQITSNAVLPFPPMIKSLEICQLGFLTVKANGAGAGTLTAVNTQLQVFGAAFVGGGTSTSAGLITTDTTNFETILSVTDVNVQAALETIDNAAVKKAASSTDNALVRYDGTTGQLIQDSLVTVSDAGAMTVGPATGLTTPHIIRNSDETNGYVLNLENTSNAAALVHCKQNGSTVGIFGSNSTNSFITQNSSLVVQSLCTQAGAWTLGPVTGATHYINGQSAATVFTNPGSGLALSASMIITGPAQGSTSISNIPRLAIVASGSTEIGAGLSGGEIYFTKQTVFSSGYSNFGSGIRHRTGVAGDARRNGLEFFASSENLQNGFVGGYSDYGAWTLGAYDSTATHVVNGNLQVTARAANSSNVAAYFTSTGVLSTVSSSRTTKKNIEDLEGGLELVKQMRPVEFDYISEENPQRKMIGLIAEELEEVCTNMVVHDEQGQPTSIFYQDLPIVLLKAMKDQQKIIEDLQRQIDRLSERLSVFAEPV